MENALKCLSPIGEEELIPAFNNHTIPNLERQLTLRQTGSIRSKVPLRRSQLSTTEKDVNSTTLDEIQVCITIGDDSLLLSLPVELHLEIASYLPADDLLCLARVCRSFRNTFMSKLNRKIWTICLCNADTPACPEDLTEPNFTSLIFDTHCEICGVSMHSNPEANVQTYYELRKRLCSSCFYCDERILSSVNEGIELVRGIDENLAYTFEIYTLIPHSGARDMVLDKNIALTNDIYALIPHESVSAPFCKRKFIKSDFTKAVNGYQDAKLISSDALLAYVKEMQSRKEAIVEHCVLIDEWKILKESEAETKKDAEIIAWMENEYSQMSDLDREIVEREFERLFRDESDDEND